MSILLLVAACYLTLNFVCALALHLQSLRHSGVAPRFLDVLMHFLLMSALAVPVLLVIAAEAFLGREKQAAPGRIGRGRAYQPAP